MEYAVVLSVIAAAHLLAAMSPGPSFIVVMQQSVARSRRAGLLAAAGIGLGSALWAVLVLLGLSLILEQATWLYATLRLLGGAYLVYLGIRLWLGARVPLDLSLPVAAVGASPWQSFRIGLLTQLLNPKAAVFFGSIFVTLLAPDLPVWLKLAVVGLIFFNEFLWYAIVAYLFSTGSARQVYARSKTWLDRILGTCLALLGARLALADR